MVIASRRLLWVLFAFMIAAIIWVTMDKNGGDGARLVFSTTKQEPNQQNVMLSPRYQGLDERNQPFVVVADKAIQEDKKTVLLFNIKADMNQNDGKWLALDSKEGKMNLDEKLMYLHGGVQLFYDGGYEMRTDHANVDIQKGSARGDGPVEGQGPIGTLQANSFSVHDRGKVIEFNGSVRMTLYP